MTINPCKAPTTRRAAKPNRNEQGSACGTRLSGVSNAWGRRWRADRQAKRKLQARHANEEGDRSSEIG
jgi:hypothetical protein